MLHRRPLPLLLRRQRGQPVLPRRPLPLLLLLLMMSSLSLQEDVFPTKDEPAKSLFPDVSMEFDELDVGEVGGLFTNLFVDSQQQLILDLDLFRTFFEYQDKYREAVQSGNTEFVRMAMVVVNKLKELDISSACLSDVFHLSWVAVEYATFVEETKNCSSCQCTPYLKQKRNERQWIFNVLDAFGKMPAGVTSGNNLWVGSWSTCRKISVAKNNQGQRWTGQYCLAHLNSYYRDNPLKTIAARGSPDAHCHTAVRRKKDSNASLSDEDSMEDNRCFDMIPLLNFGLCTPDTCTDYDVRKMLQFAYRGVEAAVGRKLVCNVSVECRNEREEHGISDNFLAMAAIVFLLLLASMATFGTLYDYLVYQSEVRDSVPKERSLFYSKTPTFIKILLAFSAYTNGKKVLATEEQTGQIGCLFGMRFLSMVWIILGHTYYYIARSLTTDNLIPTLIAFPQSFYTQIVVQAPLAVDSFFYLSGLLASYLFFKKIIKSDSLRKPEAPIIWVFYFLRRYMRLTPVYVMIMWLDVTLFTYASNGPFWRPIEATYCRKTWWVNLLYLNNFVLQHTECCMGWTWYLANDFQFHMILTPLLIIALTKSAKFGLSLAAALTIVSTAIKFYIMEINRYPPAPLLTAKLQIVEVLDSYWTDLYVKPYVRCGPFIFGIVVGFLLHYLTRKRENKDDIRINIPRWLLLTGWTTSTILGLYSVFGLYNYARTGDISDWYRILYVIAGRNGYALAISWVTFACATGNGGIVNTILSWKFFTPLGRITYGAYLVHPILLQIYNYSRPQPFHFTTFMQMFRHSFEALIISYSTALVVHLLIEAPVSVFDANLFDRHQKSRKTVERDIQLVPVKDAALTEELIQKLPNDE